MGAAVARAAVLAAACAACLGWLGLTGFAWNDYDYTAVSAMDGLVRGDLLTFLHQAPVDGPSLLLRAPFALVAPGLGGGELAVYRAIAVPALVAGAVLAVVLAAGPGSRAGRWAPLVILLVAANPVVLRGLDIGHAEELLGAALAVGAVLAARADRPWTAALLLGLAIGNKAWAVLAVGPVLVALPRHRLRTLLVAGGLGALFVLPFLVAHWGPFAPPASTGSDVAAAGGTGSTMQPWQAWWFVGHPDDAVYGYDGHVKPDWRSAPAWIGTLTHPLIALLTIPLSLLYAQRRSGDVLALLALLFALRCLLDPVNNAYYHVPLLLALAALETRTGRGVPVLTAAVTGAVWLTITKLSLLLAPDTQSLLYLAWMVPLVIGLGMWMFRTVPYSRQGLWYFAVADLTGRQRPRLPQVPRLPELARPHEALYPDPARPRHRRRRRLRRLV